MRAILIFNKAEGSIIAIGYMSVARVLLLVLTQRNFGVDAYSVLEQFMTLTRESWPFLGRGELCNEMLIRMGEPGKR